MNVKELRHCLWDCKLVKPLENLAVSTKGEYTYTPTPSISTPLTVALVEGIV